MHLTIQFQLVPTAEQKRILLATMERFNAAASYAAQVGFAAKRFSQPSIHKLCYQELRQRFGISAQMAVRAIGKAVECFQRDRTKCPTFKKYGAMIYDERFFSFKGPFSASLLTVEGRQIIPMIYGEYQKARFDRIKGQVDLVYRKGKFYLYASGEFPDGTPIEPKDFLGVDLGVANIATTSEGVRFGGEQVEQVRRKYHKHRRGLGQKMSRRHQRRTRKNARRAMKRLGNKETRFRKDVNHVITKQLVAHCKDTDCGLAVEDLNGIRDRLRFRKRQRARMGGWSFGQFRQFLEYKAQLAGVPVVVVDPRYSSRTCSLCGHCEKGNRQSQSNFHCRACGFTLHADENAALNLRARATVNWPQVTEKHKELLIA